MDALIIIFVTVLLSAFFSGMEIAFVSSNKLRLELEKKQSPLLKFFFNLFSKNPGNFLTTMLVGNNFSLVIYGVAFTKLFEPYLISFFHNEILLLLVQTLLSTLIILFLGEFIPKTLFNLNPNFALRFFAMPVGIFYFLLYPVTTSTMWISRFLLKRFFRVELKPTDQTKMFSKIDLDYLVRESQQSEERNNSPIEHEVKLFRNALDFSKVKLRECMVPRTEIEAIEVDSPMEELRQKFIETGYSKILIYKESIDNIIGYVHSSELFKQPRNLRSRINPVLIVPETMSASKLLSQFIQQHKSVAIIVDEFGGTSGMVTTEDILEEIFGEIEDEHDTEDLIDKQIGPKEFILAGRLEIDFLNEKYHIDLPVSESYETLAGLILYFHESIPKINSVITLHQYEIKILKATNTKIELIRLKINATSQN
ncbi:MAG: hemolysin family protein [Bacteroidota bacterium]|nr:hemolysin family protein [Bacteroidota bacterium]